MSSGTNHANSTSEAEPQDDIKLKEIRQGVVKDGVVEAWEEHVFLTATWQPTSTSDAKSNQSAQQGENVIQTEEELEGPRLIYALECYLYTIPSEQSSLLYVSKLDTTGFAPQTSKPKVGDEKLREYVEIIESEDAEKKRVGEFSTSTISPLKPQSTSSNRPELPRTGSFQGLQSDSLFPGDLGSLSPSSYISSPTITSILTHAFLHHFCSLSHWSPPPNQSLSSNSSQPPLPRLAVSHPFPSSGSGNSNSTPIKHLSLHILARSQGAYLFPGSPENKGKRILSDSGLIKWWRKCVGGVVRQIKNEKNGSIKNVNFNTTEIPEVESKSGDQISEGSNKGAMEIRPYYLIPGYDKLESHPLVPLILPSSSTSNRNHSETEVGWIYGHPYSREEPNPAVLPLHLPSLWPSQKKGEGFKLSIATLIPHFPDDPKSRFLDELARDAHEHAGIPGSRTSEKKEEKLKEGEKVNGGEMKEGEERVKKRIKMDENEGPEKKEGKAESGTSPPLSVKIATTSSSSSTDSSLDPNSSIPTSSASNSTSTQKLTSQQRHLQRERLALDNVSPNEFWERMGFRQECCSGNVVGAFVVGFTSLDGTRDAPISATANGGSSTSTSLSSDQTSTATDSTSTVKKNQPPKSRPFSLPLPTLPDLVLKHLMKDACDWSDLKSSIQLTKSWDRGFRKAVLSRGGVSTALVQPTFTLGEGVSNQTFTSFSIPIATSTSSTSNSDQSSGSTSASNSGSTPSTSTSPSTSISEDPRLATIGSGILWTDLTFRGPASPEMMERAKKRWEAENPEDFSKIMGEREEGGNSGNGDGKVRGSGNASGNGGVKVNTLSVKRKRKD